MYCRVTRDRIDSAGLAERVRNDTDGAVLLFIGVVRNHQDGRPVSNLRYEAYEEMAVARLKEICTGVSARHNVGEIAVVHRIGELEIGEASVAIAVASPHRDDAYRASREIIERLKVEVPIWKLERYADGGEDWVEGSEPAVSPDRSIPPVEE